MSEKFITENLHYIHLPRSILFLLNKLIQVFRLVNCIRYSVIPCILGINVSNRTLITIVELNTPMKKLELSLNSRNFAKHCIP